MPETDQPSAWEIADAYVENALRDLAGQAEHRCGDKEYLKMTHMERLRDRLIAYGTWGPHPLPSEGPALLGLERDWWNAGQLSAGVRPV